MRYVLDFGSANTGGAPSFSVFARADTLAALTPPEFTEIGAGLYLFDYDWTAAPTASVAYKATLNGIELSDVISSGAAGLSASGAVAVPAETSLVGFTTAKDIINRTAVQCGLAPVDDPFGSSDVNIMQLVEFLNTVGDDLSREHDWTHFIRECSITIIPGQTTYALPDDFHDMIDQTGWNRDTRLPLVGPLTGEATQFLKTWVTGAITRTAFRIQGNLMVFPVDTAPGKVVFEYVSSNWVQTEGSATGPDQERCTASSDYVLYDPLLAVRALKLQWRQAKEMDTTVALAEYQSTLEHAIGKNKGGAVLDLGGRRAGVHFIDETNIPTVVSGI